MNSSNISSTPFATTQASWSRIPRYLQPQSPTARAPQAHTRDFYRLYAAQILEMDSIKVATLRCMSDEFKVKRRTGKAGLARERAHALQQLAVRAATPAEAPTHAGGMTTGMAPAETALDTKREQQRVRAYFKARKQALADTHALERHAMKKNRVAYLRTAAGAVADFITEHERLYRNLCAAKKACGSREEAAILKMECLEHCRTNAQYSRAVFLEQSLEALLVPTPLPSYQMLRRGTLPDYETATAGDGERTV